MFRLDVNNKSVKIWTCQKIGFVPFPKRPIQLFSECFINVLKSLLIIILRNISYSFSSMPVGARRTHGLKKRVVGTRGGKVFIGVNLRKKLRVSIFENVKTQFSYGTIDFVKNNFKYSYTKLQIVLTENQRR